MADLAKIVDELSALTVLEAAELSKMLEEKWGVSAAAPVAVAAAPAEDGAAAGPSVVSVILSSFGESKTAVIKVVKEITGLGLVEAKGVVDKCPSPIKENIGVEEAEEIKKKLVEAGATVEIK